MTAGCDQQRRWRRGAGPLLLAAALLFVVLLGGTEAGRVATAIRAVGALVGAAVIVFYLRQMASESDLTDKLVLGGLILFLVTCVTSRTPRSSFESATSALAYVAAFYLARRAVASKRGGELAITVLGSVGIVIGIAFLIVWGSIWLRWITVPGAGLPPFDLRLPTLLYRHQYPVGILAAMLLPATLLLARRPMIWPLALVGCVATVMVAFLSGGRAIWLAGVAAVVVAVIVAVITARGGLPFHRRSIRITALVVTAGILVLVAAPFLSRLAATSTIDLRLSMWHTALAHWLDSAVAGFGPGTFAREFSMTGYYNRFEPNVPHAHNAVVQLLFEGGVVGLVGLGLVCAGVIVGVAKHGRMHWSSAAALAFFVFSSVPDNPTVVPFLLAPLIVWAALASPRVTSPEPGRRKATDAPTVAASGIPPAAPTTPLAAGSTSPRVSSDSTRRKALRALTFVAAGIVGAGMLATLGAAWAFDSAADAAVTKQPSRVVANLSTAVTLDPTFALYHRELGVWSQAEGDLSRSRNELASAIQLNRADTQAYRAAALLNAQEGNHDEAITLASSPVALQATHVENALTLAYVNGVFADLEAQHSALVAAVRFAPWLTAAPEWSLVFPNADPSAILLDAYRSWQDDDELSMRNLKARAWLAGLVGAAPPEGATPALQAEAAVLSCRTSQAAHGLADLVGPAATELETLEARLLFEKAYGGESQSQLETLIRLRDPGLASLIATQAIGVSPVWSFFYDNRHYDRQAISPPAGPLLPTTASGISAWLRDPVAAADRGAPNSGLAKCQ